MVGVLGRSDREMVVLEQGDLEPVGRTGENPAPADRETRARMVENRAGITLTMEIPLRGRPDSRRGPAAWI
jgi:hypothetical protein